MYKRIQVAIDGSETGARALAEAVRLTAESKGKLRIAFAVELINANWDIDMPEAVNIHDWMILGGQETLHRAETTARASGIQFDTRLIEITTLGQRIPEAIAAEAEVCPADLIVIGTHGRRGLSRPLLGSVAEGVVRVANKPVLLIREQTISGHSKNRMSPHKNRHSGR